jgi:hypothetical protein
MYPFGFLERVFLPSPIRMVVDEKKSAVYSVMDVE